MAERTVSMRQQLPKVSIIMPTYNRGHAIESAIRSVQQQDFSHWELVIVDDGSTDHTQHVIAGFTDDSRVRYVKYDKNRGVSYARNIGIAHAKSEYIAYLDSDNYMYHDWLSSMFDYIGRHPGVSWLYPRLNTTILDETSADHSITLSESIVPAQSCHIEDLWAMNFQADPNGLVHRRSLIKGDDAWDLSIESYGDYEYALKLSLVDPGGFAVHPLALGRYVRVYGQGGMCSSRGYKQIISGLLYIRNAYEDFTEWNKHTDIDARIKRYTECLNKGLSPIEGLRNKYEKIQS